MKTDGGDDSRYPVKTDGGSGMGEGLGAGVNQ